MSTYFISDLHLCDQQPLITKKFIEFCQTEARQARALYILGDLFEYWLGDDVIDKTAQIVQKQLLELSQHGVALFFMAGNRDFLLGTDYANSCGMTVLEEPSVVEVENHSILLVHGDAECIDDVAYQHVRTMIRNPQWQQEFLNKSVPERIAFAKEARQQSQQHTRKANHDSEVIMDVNQDVINDLFKKHQVKTIIHGHTHRPAIHQHGANTRIVLGDWHHQSSFLKYDEHGYQLISN